jgi:hypothetical protein
VSYDGTSSTVPVTVSVSPVPIAPAGSLRPAQSVNVTANGYDSSGACVSGGPIYLYFNGPGSATPGTTAKCTPLTSNGSLGPNESACNTDSNGTVTVVFTTPNPLPLGTSSQISASTNNSASTASTASVAQTYYDYPACHSYVQGSTTITQVALNPTPIAPTASLPPANSVTVNAKAIDSAGNCVANAPIYLAFVGSGSANVGSPAWLGSTWQQATTNPQGVVPITYQTPAQLPNGSQDNIYAAITNTAAPTSGLSTSYTYGTLTAQGLNPTVAEGQYFSGEVATFQTNNTFYSTLSATIYWGDGTSGPGTIGQYPNGSLEVSGAKLYPDENPSEPVSVVISEYNGPTVTAHSTIDATDAPLTASGGLKLTGHARNATYWNLGSFTDPAPEGLTSYTATVNWGDGTTPTSGGVYTINGSNGSNGYGFDGTHAYKSKGTYTVTVTITDDGGATTAITDTAYITR